LILLHISMVYGPCVPDVPVNLEINMINNIYS